MVVKTSESVGSAAPDPIASSATIAPIPQPVISNKPAPGQTGPKGMQPRQTYSRVNTGAPPTPDAGTSTQKNSPIRGMEFLPAKVASAEATMTTMMKRPDLNELVKQAMAGTLSKADINAQVARLSLTGNEKTASAAVSTDPTHVSTEMVHKLASAVGFIAEQMLKEADNTLEPGKGPGALELSSASSSETNIDAGESGQATGAAQPPTTPALQAEKVQSGAAGTGLETNDEMSHPEQPESPISNETASIAAQKTAEALFLKNANRLANFGSAAKSVLTGSKARSIHKDLKTHHSSLPSAIRKPMEATRNREAAKTLGAHAGIAAAGGGAALAAKGGKKKEGEAENHHVRRALLGNPISAAIEAKPGKKGKAAWEGWKHRTVETLKGQAKGIGAGGAAGGLIGAGVALSKGKKGLKDLGKSALQGAGHGALGGSIVGGVAGNIKGNHGEKATKIHKEHSKHAAPIALLRKLAEDAINPAQISGKGSLNPSVPPDGVSASEEAKPPVPSDVSKQQNMVSSNQAAIDYTKRDAKADPKSDVNQVLVQPALSSSTDKVLDKVWDHTDEAGAKISSVRDGAIKTAAARVLLSRLVKQATEAPADLKGKKKNSQGMGGGAAPNTPAAASGFTASSI